MLCKLCRLTERHPRRRTRDRREKRRSGDRGGIDAAVLAAIGDHVDGDQLQGGDVDDQERAHLVAGGPDRAFPSVRFFF